MANKSITDKSIVTTAQNRIASNPTKETEFWNTQQAPAGTSLRADTPTQSTSLPPQTGGGFVSDVSMSAYMRAVNIDIVARNLRPNRRIYVYFDGKDVTKLMQKPNIITCWPPFPPPDPDANNVVNKTPEDLDILEGNAKVLYAKRKGNEYYLYIGEIFGANNQVDTANAELVVINTRTGARSNVINQKHASGVLKSAQKYLKKRPEGMTAGQWQKEMVEKRYWSLEGVNLKKEGTANLVGQTITILSGPNPGQTTKILSYNVANGEIYLSRGLPELIYCNNVVYSIGNLDPNANANNTVVIDGQPVYYDSGAPDVVPSVNKQSSGNLYTDENGTFVGTLRLPDPIVSPEYRFKVGEKLLRITDSPVNDPDDATTIAEYNFVAYGLNLSTSQLVINGVPIKISANNVIPGSNTTSNSSNTTIIRTKNKEKKRDPIAQSFYVDPEEYPNGFFTPFVDLFFANKGVLPVEVQIRSMVNGFPSSTEILPNAVSIKDSDEVNVTELPDPTNANSYTRFEFTSPIYLQAGTEYALVVLTNDFDYDIYVSELGEKIIGTDRIVSEQPYLGSLFKSQNATTYTPIQSEDLMFVIHKCQFEAAGAITFAEKKDRQFSKPIFEFNSDANTKVDAFEVHSDVIELPGTTLQYSYRSMDAVTEDLDDTYTVFKPEKRTLVNKRKLVYSPDIPTESFFMRVDMTTNSTDISPVLYTNKQSLSTLETQINNLSLDGRRVVVANTGNGYTRQNTSVSITSNTGQGANAFILTKVETIPTGKIETLFFDSNGYGYYDDVNVSITSTDANVTPAVIEIQSETGKFGGPAEARYISKTVTLAPEFDAGDLRVYVTAIKPREADIQIYYKIRNNFDNESIDDKKWIRMVQVPGVTDFSQSLDAIEFEYRPSLTSNNIIYSTDNATFNTFNQYKIKIVMGSTDTVLQKIPYIYDMRAIALPGDD